MRARNIADDVGIIFSCFVSRWRENFMESGKSKLFRAPASVWGGLSATWSAQQLNDISDFTVTRLWHKFSVLWGAILMIFPLGQTWRFVRLLHFELFPFFRPQSPVFTHELIRRKDLLGSPVKSEENFVSATFQWSEQKRVKAQWKG